MSNRAPLSVEGRLVRAAATLLGCAALAACASAKEGRVAPERAPIVSQARVVHGVTFGAGHGGLSAAEAARLREFARATVREGDEVTLFVEPAGSPEMQQARVAAVSAALRQDGVAAIAGARRIEMAIGGDNVLVVVNRYVARVPNCPDWSKSPGYDPYNTAGSNFGCATAANLGAMVANPRDLVIGRDPGPADANTGAAAVDRYRRGAIRVPANPGTGAPAPAAANQPQGGGAPAAEPR